MTFNLEEMSMDESDATYSIAGDILIRKLRNEGRRAVKGPRHDG
jgi:hypothetical protein